jgi:hypothetical protein
MKRRGRGGEKLKGNRYAVIKRRLLANTLRAHACSSLLLSSAARSLFCKMPNSAACVSAMRRSRSSASATRDFSVRATDFSSRRAASSFSIARRDSSFTCLPLAPASCVCSCGTGLGFRVRFQLHCHQNNNARGKLVRTCICCNSPESRPISPSASACSSCSGT